MKFLVLRLIHPPAGQYAIIFMAFCMVWKMKGVALQQEDMKKYRVLQGSAILAGIEIKAIKL